MSFLFVIPFFLFIFLNYIPVFITKKSFGYCITTTMICSALIMYFGQLCFHTYRYPFFLLLGLSAFGFVLFLISLIRDRERIKVFFSTAFWAFLVIFIFYLIVDTNRSFVIFDEFYHWGTMIKESFRLDSFYSVPESNLWIHKDYPPFMTMLELLWCKLCRGYSESAASMAMHVFCMSALLCFVLDKISEGIKKNPFWKMLYSFLLLIPFLMLIMLLDPWPDKVVTSILVDVLLPVLFAYAMLLIYTGDAFNSKMGVVNVVAVCTAIMMTKQSGAFFVLVITLYYILKAVFVRKTALKQRIANIIKAVCPAVISYLTLMTWKKYIAPFNIQGQFNTSELTLSDYAHVLTGETEGLIHETVSSFFKALISRPISSVEWIPLTYAAAFVLFTAVTVLLFVFFRKIFTGGNAVIIGVTLAAGHIGYACMMAILYAYFFNVEEMKILASYERYMASFALGEVLFLLLVFLYCLSKAERVSMSLWKIAIPAACAILAFNPYNMRFIAPQGLMGEFNRSGRMESESVAQKTHPGDNIFVIYDNTKIKPSWWGAYQVYVQYYLNDRYVSRENVSAFGYDMNDTALKERLLSSISKCDYLYIRDINPGLNELLKEYCGKDIESNTVYRVTKGLDKTGISSINKV